MIQKLIITVRKKRNDKEKWRKQEKETIQKSIITATIKRKRNYKKKSIITTKKRKEK